MNASEPPVRTPASVARSLASLRLEHGRVSEEFGALKAVLRQKEQEMLDLTAQDDRSKQAIASLEKQFRALEDKAGRNERRAILAEREVSFLQAMLVSCDSLSPRSPTYAIIDKLQCGRLRQIFHYG